jgi:hypothetical protein
VIPFYSTYLKALSISPPLHPILPKDDEQSTNYYSEKDGRGDTPLTPARPSRPPVVEKAQHDPHYP